MRSFGIKVFAALVQLCIITQGAYITAENGTTFDDISEIDARGFVNCASPVVPRCREGTEALCNAGCRPGVKNFLTSVHNCKGNAYLCLVNNVAYCVKPKHPGPHVGTNTENGRCFS